MIRSHENNMGRMTENSEFEYWLADRINVLEKETNKELNVCSSEQLKNSMNNIHAISNSIYDDYQKMSPERQEKVRESVMACHSPFLNKSRFSDCRALAIFYNFAPFVDPAAYSSTKLLSKIAELTGKKTLDWDVVAQNMGYMCPVDEMFDNYYASCQYTRRIILDGVSDTKSAQSLIDWAHRAIAAVKEEHYTYLFTRSMLWHSHVAGLLYKKQHPDVIWYAAFGDPFAIAPDGRTYQTEAGENYFAEVEAQTFELADVIIFTNEKQQQFTLNSLENPILREKAAKKSIIIEHVRLPEEFLHLMPDIYPVDAEKINIGYFGSFYRGRTMERLYPLLRNPKVILHLFMVGTVPDLSFLSLDEQKRIKINKPVSHLEMFPIMRELDYLVITELPFDGPINPYVPSKYVDAKSVDTPVILLADQGSTLAERKDAVILKAFSSLELKRLACQLRKTYGKSDKVSLCREITVRSGIPVIKKKIIPEISVIIVFHHAKIHLAQCLESLIAQNLTAWEAICVDVGSDDGSGAIADRYACRDSRIKIIHLSAQAGVLQGRKHAVDSAQSEYIMFLDGNAYLQEDACQKILAEEAVTGADILGYGVTEVSDNNSETKAPQRETAQNILLKNRHESLLPIYLENKGLTSGWNKCFQATLCKDAFHQMEGLPLYGMEEVYAFVIIYSMGKSFHACPFSVAIQYGGYSISERVSWNKKEFKLAATEKTALEGIKRYLAREHVEAGDWLQKMQKQAVEGQIKRLNIITNPSYYLAGWQCLLEQWGSFVLSQYLYTIDNMPIPAYQHMVEFNRNLQERISSTENQLMQENINCKRQIEDLVNNRSFKLGRLLTFIPRKIREAIRCYRSQGLRGVVQLCKKRLQEKGV